MEEVTEGSPSSHIAEEHCYYKPTTDDAESMEIDAPAKPVTGSPSLTSLDASKDTFETFLLHLLQAFTSHQHSSNPTISSEKGSAPTPTHTTQSSIGPSNSDISTESLNSLSPEQVSMLITSNSVNYEVIQQILAQKQKHSSNALANVNNVGRNVLNQSPALEGGKDAPSPLHQTSQESDEKSLSSSETSASGSGGPPPSQEHEQIQVTPEQLQILQERVSELLRQQEITLPSEMSMEQQHALIQTLLIRQMHLMQEKGESFSLPNVDSTSVKAPPSTEVDLKGSVVLEEKRPSVVMQILTGKEIKEEKPQAPATNQPQPPSSGLIVDKPSSIVAAVASKPSTSGGGGGRRKKSGDPNEPKKPSMPYNIFFSEVYSTVLAANQKMGFSEASKLISMMWNAMGSDVKKKYYDQHDKLKEEYKEALQKYKASKPAESAQQVNQADGEKQVAGGPVHLKQEPKDPSLCVNGDCTNVAIFTEERGPRYCSNECIITHCRNEFTAFVNSRKIKV